MIKMDFFRNMWSFEVLSKILLLFLAVILHLIILETNGAADGNSDQLPNYSYTKESDDNYYSEEDDYLNSEEIALESGIDDSFEAMCLWAYGECWNKLKSRRDINETSRRALCLHRVRGWEGLCDTMDENDATQAIAEADKRTKEDHDQKAHLNARQKKLKKRVKGFKKRLSEIKRASVKRPVSTATDGYYASKERGT